MGKKNRGRGKSNIQKEPQKDEGVFGGIFDIYNQFYENQGEVLRNGRPLDNILPNDDNLKHMISKYESKAEQELSLKMMSALVFGEGTENKYEDSDQSPLSGDDEEILIRQWSTGMDYNPVHNDRLSEWVRALWCGDYNKVTTFLKNKTPEAINRQLEARESLLHISGVFHVIFGARTLCGDSPVYKMQKTEAMEKMDVKFEHLKISKMLIEMKVNLAAKDVAGYSPLHHCLNAYSNSVTVQMAKLLLKAGVDPNIKNRFGVTPLAEPVLAAKLENVSLLLKYGCDPDISDNNGISCLCLASRIPKVMTLICAARKSNIKTQRQELREAGGGTLRKCQQCGQGHSEMKRCKGCYLVHYCGPDCQKEAWSQNRM